MTTQGTGEGAVGADVDVRALQAALQQAGFPPGAIDGEVGEGTRAAVMAFQRSAGLLPDGIAGPLTRARLGLGGEGVRPRADHVYTLQVTARIFPGAPLANLRLYLPVVLQAMADAVLGDAVMLSMALATIRAETAGFEPIDEGLSRYNTSPNGHAFDLYDRREDLGNRGAPDGESFRGRGFVQLTGLANYRTYGERLGIDLVAEPRRANEPAIAARLLALFLGDREGRIRSAVLEQDLRRARRLVNGGSHGLEAFSQAFALGMQAAQAERFVTRPLPGWPGSRG